MPDLVDKYLPRAAGSWDTPRAGCIHGLLFSRSASDAVTRKDDDDTRDVPPNATDSNLDIRNKDRSSGLLP